jgi:hypothetical protein
MTTIEQLRKDGNKVRVSHYRKTLAEVTWNENFIKYLTYDKLVLESEVREKGLKFAPTGGKTVLSITTTDGRDITVESRCSDQDNYNKKIGIRLALSKLQ